jgi:hypothetical protein
MLVWWFGEGVMGTSVQPASVGRVHLADSHSRFPNYLCAPGHKPQTVPSLLSAPHLHGLRVAPPLLCTRVRRSNSSRLASTLLMCWRTLLQVLSVHVQSSACSAGAGTSGLRRARAHMILA